MDTLERHANKYVGIGGYKCNCCGPSPKQRPKHRRRVRRNIKEQIMKQVRTYNESVTETPSLL